jgi:hypothetical protein
MSMWGIKGLPLPIPGRMLASSRSITIYWRQDGTTIIDPANEIFSSLALDPPGSSELSPRYLQYYNTPKTRCIAMDHLQVTCLPVICNWWCGLAEAPPIGHQMLFNSVFFFFDTILLKNQRP